MRSDVPPRPDLPSPAGEGVPTPLTVPPPMPVYMGRPAATWRWWEALLVFIGAVVVGVFVSAPVLGPPPQSGLRVMLSSVTLDAVVLGVLIAWLETRHKGWRLAIGLPAHLPEEIWQGFWRGMVLMILANLVVVRIVYVFLHDVSQKHVRSPQQIPSNPRGPALAVTIAMVVFVAPIVEEFFFRGCFFRSLRARNGFVLSALGSAILFGGIHYQPDPWQNASLLMVVMVFVGFGLAYIYEKRGNIVASMTAHATFNAVNLALLLLHR